MRARDDVRDALDTAVQTASSAREAAGGLTATLRVMEERLSRATGKHKDSAIAPAAAQSQAEELALTLKAELSPAHEIASRMRADTARLSIRLENDHPVVFKQHKLTNVVFNWLHSLGVDAKRGSRSDSRKTDEQWAEEFRDAFADFQEACRLWLNS